MTSTDPIAPEQPSDPAMFAPLTTDENKILGAHLTSGWYKQSAVYPVLSEPWQETAGLPATCTPRGRPPSRPGPRHEGSRAGRAGTRGRRMSFPDDSPVEVRYPVDGTPTKTSAGTTVYISDVPRESWPWLPGVIEQQCGPDEWQVTVLARELAELEDGTRAPEGTPDEQLYYPSCFRDASELRPQATEPEAGL